jgi:hypothetical protein
MFLFGNVFLVVSMINLLIFGELLFTEVYAFYAVSIFTVAFGLLFYQSHKTRYLEIVAEWEAIPNASKKRLDRLAFVYIAASVIPFVAFVYLQFVTFSAG